MYTLGEIDTIPQLDPYHQDTGQATVTVLKIYEDGEIAVTQEYDDNATPEDEWNGRTVTLTVPGHPDGQELRLLLTNNPLIERIIDGHSVEWNGSNLVGNLTDDAGNAIGELERELSDLEDKWTYYTPEDWLGNLNDEELGLPLSPDQISAYAERLESDAIADENVIVEGVADYLRRRQEEYEAEHEDA